MSINKKIIKKTHDEYDFITKVIRKIYPIAAKRNNRKFIGIEIDKKYFDIAEKRINEYQGVLI